MTKDTIRYYVKNLVLGLIQSNKMNFYNSSKITKLTYKHLLKWSKINQKIYGSYILDDEQINQTIQFVREESTKELLKHLILSNKISLNITKEGELGYNVTDKGLAYISKKTKKVITQI